MGPVSVAGRPRASQPGRGIISLQNRKNGGIKKVTEVSCVKRRFGLIPVGIEEMFRRAMGIGRNRALLKTPAAGKALAKRGHEAG